MNDFLKRSVVYIQSSGTCVQIAYILKANAGTFVKTPCLRAGFAFLGMHARANISHCFDYFLHFMFLMWYEDTTGNKFGGDQSLLHDFEPNLDHQAPISRPLKRHPFWSFRHVPTGRGCGPLASPPAYDTAQAVTVLRFHQGA